MWGMCNHITSKARLSVKKHKLVIINNFSKVNYSQMDTDISKENRIHIISEGLATVKTSGKVFYNAVQEFNRDLRYT